jgi:hypothetical protein
MTESQQKIKQLSNQILEVATSLVTGYPTIYFLRLRGKFPNSVFKRSDSLGMLFKLTISWCL